MRVLIVGSGGREHALAWKLAQEATVFAAPGNPGIAACATTLAITASDFEGIAAAAKAERIDLVVIGPEDPLIAGLADRLRAEGLAVFGPGAEGARLEGSKAFAKGLMRRACVPTADFETFDDPAEAHAYVDRVSWEVVVKASGAALGKGVIVCGSSAEAHDAVDAMLNERAFGEASSTIVIERRLVGAEFSLLTLCSDSEIRSLPVALDYKRALDGNRGPNTGGMGSVSPAPGIGDDLVRRAEREVVLPVLDELRSQGVAFRGVLFSGMMLHEGRPHCLEFNVRFGDPETQSVVRRVGDGFADALLACARGEKIPAIPVLDHAAVSLVLASGGYPGPYEKGKRISIGPLPEGVQAFHAGTSLSDGQLVTSGGRVLALSAVAATVPQARRLAYEAAEAVRFEGMRCRSDIGA